MTRIVLEIIRTLYIIVTKPEKSDFVHRNGLPTYYQVFYVLVAYPNIPLSVVLDVLRVTNLSMQPGTFISRANCVDRIIFANLLCRL